MCRCFALTSSLCYTDDIYCSEAHSVKFQQQNHTTTAPPLSILINTSQPSPPLSLWYSAPIPQPYFSFPVSSSLSQRPEGGARLPRSLTTTQSASGRTMLISRFFLINHLSTSCCVVLINYRRFIDLSASRLEQYIHNKYKRSFKGHPVLLKGWFSLRSVHTECYLSTF